MNDFQERLASLKSGMKDAEFARKVGIPGATLKRYEDGSLPSIGLASKIADAFSVSLDWLAGRSQDPSTRVLTQLHDNPSADSRDFVAVPFMDIEASAGVGVTVPMHEIEVRSIISFERSFLRSLGASPDWCRIISARGDSMFPTIPDGALIVIDHSQQEIVNGWISVINVAGDLLVKRVRRRLDGMIELISDNPIYPAEVIGNDRVDQLSIIGRVVYFCRAP